MHIIYTKNIFYLATWCNFPTKGCQLTPLDWLHVATFGVCSICRVPIWKDYVVFMHTDWCYMFMWSFLSWAVTPQWKVFCIASLILSSSTRSLATSIRTFNPVSVYFLLNPLHNINDHNTLSNMKMHFTCVSCEVSWEVNSNAGNYPCNFWYLILTYRKRRTVYFS